MARVASLHIYPVKSCRGIDLATAEVTALGLAWDRRWMIVDAADRFITQRTHPRLATIGTAIGDGLLTLSADGQPPLRLDADAGASARRVRIWRDSCAGLDAGDDAADWLARALGGAFRLMRIDERVERLADPECAGPAPQPISFTDGFPVLLISRESLAELNRRLPAPVPMNRFRPSIVIEGVAAHAEDGFGLFRSGAVVLRGVKHCTRCVTTTTDQETGTRNPEREPLATLRRYRYDRRLQGVAFGQNCVIAGGIGSSIAVGDPFELPSA